MAGENPGQSMTSQVRLDALIGREVWTLDQRRLGRLEECRAEFDGRGWRVRDWMIGPAGMIARLGLSARLLVGSRQRHGYIARWDQLDVSDPARLRLTCAASELSSFEFERHGSSLHAGP
jgi:hypothetical protein